MTINSEHTMKTYTNTGNKDTRSGFGAGLEVLGKTNKNVVALCADLTGSLKMDAFKANHPERFFQVGIAEANMIGLCWNDCWWKNSFHRNIC